MELVVVSSRDLGVLETPASVSARDGAASGLVGGHVVWTFGDTLLRHPAADGMGYRTSTAAFGDPGNPLAVSDPLDDAGAPFEFIPFTQGERDYNGDGGPDDRVALWPGSLVEVGDAGLLQYAAIQIHPGFLNYGDIGSGWATLDGVHATRDADFLFHAPEPNYNLAALVFEDHVYLYACTANGTFDTPCTVARATIAQAHERTAYTFWDGASWNVDWAAATAVFTGAPGDCSVQWSGHLGQFVAVHSEIFGNHVYAHTAPRPEGPWTAAITLLDGQAPPDGGGDDYAGKGHPEFAPDGGNTLIITYARPLGGFDGEVRAAEITLR